MNVLDPDAGLVNIFITFSVKLLFYKFRKVLTLKTVKNRWPADNVLDFCSELLIQNLKNSSIKFLLKILPKKQLQVWKCGVLVGRIGVSVEITT